MQTPEVVTGFGTGAGGVFSVHLPWYRIIAAFSATRSLPESEDGKISICHRRQTLLNQRDLAQVQFIYAREPPSTYLLRHDSYIEPWPEQLLEAYRSSLIRHLCLQVWYEPVSSLRSQLVGSRTLHQRVPRKHAALQTQHGFKALRHQHWHI